MAKRKHTPQEAMSKLRQGEAAISEGSTVAEASRMIGVSKQTLYRWRAGHRWVEGSTQARNGSTSWRPRMPGCSERYSACRGTTTLYSRWRRASLSARPVAATALSASELFSASLSDVPAGCSANTAPRSAASLLPFSERVGAHCRQQ